MPALSPKLIKLMTLAAPARSGGESSPFEDEARRVPPSTASTTRGCSSATAPLSLYLHSIQTVASLSFSPPPPSLRAVRKSARDGNRWSSGVRSARETRETLEIFVTVLFRNTCARWLAYSSYPGFLNHYFPFFKENRRNEKGTTMKREEQP